MKAWLRALGYGASRAVRGLARRPVATALAIGAIAVSALLVALVHLAAFNVAALTRAWSGGAHMIVYVDADASPERIDEIAAALRRLEAVERVGFVSAADARVQLRAALGEHADLLDDLELGLLPASLEVTLRHGVTDVVEVSPMVARLREAPGVESVELLGDWLARLGAFLAALRLAALAIAIVVAAAGGYVIATTIQLSLRERQLELAALELVGATSRYICAPLVLEGAMQGALGASLAAIAAWSLYASGAEPVASALSAAFGPVALSFLPPGDLALLIAAGAAVGGIGGWLSLAGARGGRALA